MKINRLKKYLVCREGKLTDPKNEKKRKETKRFPTNDKKGKYIDVYV